MAAPDDIFAGTSIFTTRVERTFTGGRDNAPSTLTLTELTPGGNMFTDQSFNSEIDDSYETADYLIKSEIFTLSSTLPYTNTLDQSYNPTDEPINLTSSFVNLGDPITLPKYSDFVQVSGWNASDLSSSLFDGKLNVPAKAVDQGRNPFLRWNDGTNSGLLTGKVRVYVWYEGFNAAPGGLTHYYKLNGSDVVPTFESVDGSRGWVTLQEDGPFTSFEIYQTNITEINITGVEVNGELLIDSGRRTDIFFDTTLNFDIITVGETILQGTVTGKRYVVVGVNTPLKRLTVTYKNSAGDPKLDTPETYQMYNSVYRKQNHRQMISGNVGTADESYLPGLGVNHYSASTTAVDVNTISQATFVFENPLLDEDGTPVADAFSVGLSNKVSGITGNMMTDSDTKGHWYSSNGLSYLHNQLTDTINTQRWGAGDEISIICDYPDSLIYYFKNGKVYDIVELTDTMKTEPLYFCSNIYVQGNVTVTYGTLNNISTKYLELTENNGDLDVTAATTSDPGYVNMPQKSVDINFPSDL